MKPVSLSICILACACIGQARAASISIDGGYSYGRLGAQRPYVEVFRQEYDISGATVPIVSRQTNLYTIGDIHADGGATAAPGILKANVAAEWGAVPADTGLSQVIDAKTHAGFTDELSYAGTAGESSFFVANFKIAHRIEVPIRADLGEQWSCAVFEDGCSGYRHYNGVFVAGVSLSYDSSYRRPNGNKYQGPSGFVSDTLAMSAEGIDRDYNFPTGDILQMRIPFYYGMPFSYNLDLDAYVRMSRSVSVSGDPAPIMIIPEALAFADAGHSVYFDSAFVEDAYGNQVAVEADRLTSALGLDYSTSSVPSIPEPSGAALTISGLVSLGVVFAYRTGRRRPVPEGAGNEPRALLIEYRHERGRV